MVFLSLCLGIKWGVVGLFSFFSLLRDRMGVVFFFFAQG